MNQSLAILVTSSRHPDYVRQLARAACQKGKSVKVHFAGDGVALATARMRESLAAWAEVTVCPTGPGPEDAGDARTDPSRLAELIAGCDRYVVF